MVLQLQNLTVGNAAPTSTLNLPKGSYVVPFWGSILESSITNPKRNYIGARVLICFLLLLEV